MMLLLMLGDNEAEEEASERRNTFGVTVLGSNRPISSRRRPFLRMMVADDGS